MSDSIAVRTFGSRSGSTLQRMCSKFMELTVLVGSFYARSCVGGSLSPERTCHSSGT